MHCSDMTLKRGILILPASHQRRCRVWLGTGRSSTFWLPTLPLAALCGTWGKTNPSSRSATACPRWVLRLQCACPLFVCLSEQGIHSTLFVQFYILWKSMDNLCSGVTGKLSTRCKINDKHDSLMQNHLSQRLLCLVSSGGSVAETHVY